MITSRERLSERGGMWERLAAGARPLEVDPEIVPQLE
jgi:hypothetical protein